MNYSKLTSISLCLIMISAGSFANTRNDPNQIDFTVISDLHVDRENRYEPVDINPITKPKLTKGGLGMTSFKILINEVYSSPKIRENPSFVVLLGDIPVHGSHHKKDKPYKTLFDVFKILNKHSSTYNLPLLYSFGNNDSLAGDYKQFVSDGKSAYTISRDAAYKDMVGGFLSSGKSCSPLNSTPCIINQNTEYGYYSAYIADKLKLISLNSSLFVHSSSFAPSRKGDEDHLKWVMDELNNSKINNEQVIFVMHARPQSWLSDYHHDFKTILSNYSDIVIGILAGHSHFDSVYWNKFHGHTIPTIIVPGLSVGHGNSSAFKTISISRPSNDKAWKVKNYTTYYFNGKYAPISSLTKYYDFNSRFCGTTPFIDCLNYQTSTHRRQENFEAKTKAFRLANPKMEKKVMGADSDDSMNSQLFDNDDEYDAELS